MITKIGWIGTGNLGTSIVKRLLNQGYEVYVYNRSKDKATKLGEFGAHVVPSPQHISYYCKLIFLCLSDEKAVQSVLFLNKNALFRNQENKLTIFDTSTISPKYAVEFSTNVAKFDSYYIESPVSGGPENAINGDLTTILAGHRGVINSNKHIIESFSKKVFEFYTPGKAQILKILNNLAESINLIGAAEVISMGKREGLSLEEMYDVFQSTRGNSRYMNVLFERLISPKDNVSASINVRLKDLHLASDIIQNNNFTPISELVHSLFQEIVNVMDGDLDQTACINLYNNEGDFNEGKKQNETTN
ncbi:3-hydroxyisobutyrate dehydrogenase [Salinibacillus kushneri]|uniref:3-hydroxyisobutyrate dehydrogenase n=1 Tax=Salinibacillus kushneri TaxID=237682 RepID=A0A1I0EW25_9BACI|nr:NAD(P)-dependent oxidoreductase [Salinibacillus kushneri]SET49341.1 3-hydroxyisobutyrate dehydrogenase [Salinibacillus kushneri]